MKTISVLNSWWSRSSGVDPFWGWCIKYKLKAGYITELIPGDLDKIHALLGIWYWRDLHFTTSVVHADKKQTLSCNHCMQRAPSLSSKNPTPNWLANKGMYSMIASRTLQCLSSASSTMAGNNDCDSRSIPITCKESSFQHYLTGKKDSFFHFTFIQCNSQHIHYDMK